MEQKILFVSFGATIEERRGLVRSLAKHVVNLHVVSVHSVDQMVEMLKDPFTAILLDGALQSTHPEFAVRGGHLVPLLRQFGHRYICMVSGTDWMNEEGIKLGATAAVNKATLLKDSSLIIPFLERAGVHVKK